MKTLLAWLLLIGACTAQSVTVTGSVTDSSGAPAATGYVQFTLTPTNANLPYTVTGTSILAPGNSRCGISSGTLKNLALIGPCIVWGNDVISPPNNLYNIVVAPNNKVAYSLQNRALTGASADLSHLTAISPQPVIGTVLQANPIVTMGIQPVTPNVYNIGFPNAYATIYSNSLNVLKYIDLYNVSPLANPPAGYCRLFHNLNSGFLTGINSAGGTCNSSGGGVSGTVNQIIVNNSQVSLANPLVTPGPVNVNGALGVSSASSGVYFNPDTLCAWQGTATFQDQLCDLSNYGPIWNRGVGQSPLGFQLNKIQLGDYTQGQFNSYNAINGDFEIAANITAFNGTLNAISFGAANGNFSNLTGTFSVSSSLSSFVLGITPVNPCCSLPGGSMWMLDPSLHSFAHLVYFDPESNYDLLLTNNDTVCDFSGGCTGTPTGGAYTAVLQTAPVLINPTLGNATGTSLTLSSTTGDNMDLQQGLVTPFVQATPAAGHVKTGYGSDGTFKLSNGSATDNAFYSVTQTVAKGTATMTTAGISTGACGTTVTVAATGVATTDTIEAARNAAATIGNGGGLTLNWWPTANNVNFNYCNSAAGTITPTAITVNWRVTR